MADKETRNYVRSRMRKYNDFRKEVTLFEEAIRYPWTEIDENIGGGRGSKTSNPTEQQAIAMMTNEQLKSRLQLINTMDYIIDSCLPEVQKVINLRYKSHYSWIKVAQETGYSEDNCRKIDCKIVDRIANMIRLPF